MMQQALFFLLTALTIFGTEQHYDCIFIGTSPLPLFEALYQHAIGKSVLILEEAHCCGGAWQSVDICGVLHADVGCHEIGNSVPLKEFLEEYGGCSLQTQESGNSFYFSGGCYELVHNLERRIQNSSIHLLKNHKVDHVWCDAQLQTAIVSSEGQQFTCHQVYVPSYVYFPIGDETPKEPQKTKYPHLYMLINDPTPARFAYRTGIANSSRMMNLTHYVDLDGTGQQLIMFQTWNTDISPETFLSALKMQNLVDPSAYILNAEWFIYEQYQAHTIKAAGNPCFVQLQTSNFRDIISHIDRWKEVLVPYAEAVH
jgi:hypothetical protein